jgi:hypothetical protein
MMIVIIIIIIKCAQIAGDSSPWPIKFVL